MGATLLSTALFILVKICSMGVVWDWLSNETKTLSSTATVMSIYFDRAIIIINVFYICKSVFINFGTVL